MEQQTAIEWLEEELAKNLKHIVQNADSDLIESLFEQAKQKEKENFVKFFVWFRDNGEKHIGMSIEQLVEQYYKEIYGS